MIPEIPQIGGNVETLTFLFAAGLVAFCLALLVGRVVEAILDVRRQDARLRRVLEDPMRYCQLGHVHDSRLAAWECEAAHGLGD